MNTRPHDIRASDRPRRVLNRRQALKFLAAASGGWALTSVGVMSETRPRRLGLCSICYWLQWPSVMRGKGPAQDVLQFIEYSRQLGSGGVQTSLPPDPATAAQVREKIEAAEMYFEGQAAWPPSPSDLEPFESQVRLAKEAGARVVRTACLSGRRYETFSTQAAFADFAQEAERTLARVEPIVRKHRIRLAIENHKDWLVPEMVGLLGRISSEYIGVCVDTGNSIALLEDPMAVIDAYAPYAFSTHLKDMGVQEYADGFLLSEVPLGEGFLDLNAIVSRLQQAQPEIQFSLEMITRDPLKVPCLLERFWATLEAVPARRLAATLATVRSKASQRPLPQVTGLSREERLRLEDDAVRKSMAHARAHLRL